MSYFSFWLPRITALLTLGVTTPVIVPFIDSAPALTQASTLAPAARFSDVEPGYWARPFIQALAAKNIITGYPDGNFRPNQPVDRAEFATMLQRAFNQKPIQELDASTFTDIPSNYWATAAIQEAYQTGFMAGYPNNQFLPNQRITKVQVLVSLASGLRYAPTRSTSTDLSVYGDAGQIPDYALNGVAAATEKGVIVNYPNLKFLNPHETATRANVAAYIYQALVNQGEFQPLSTGLEDSQYVVPGLPSTDPDAITQKTGLKILKNTRVKVKHPVAGVTRIIVAPGETIQTALEVAGEVKNLKDEVVIPIASPIEGQLVPVNVAGSAIPGIQFVADKLILRGQAYTNLKVTSDPIVATNEVTTEMVQDARATLAAQAILARILGETVNLSRLLAGTLTVELTNPPVNPNQNSVIVIELSTDLLLTFRSDLNR